MRGQVVTLLMALSPRARARDNGDTAPIGADSIGIIDVCHRCPLRVRVRRKKDLFLYSLTVFILFRSPSCARAMDNGDTRRCANRLRGIGAHPLQSYERKPQPKGGLTYAA